MQNKSIFILLFKSLLMGIIMLIGINCLGSFFNTDSLSDFGQKSWKAFYKKGKNSIDLMFFGNSHIYNGISGKIIDAKLSTNTYTISSPSQTIYQTYFNIKEALNYQNPKLIIIETYSFQERNITVENLKKIDSGKAYNTKLASISAKNFGITKLSELNTLFNGNYLNVLFPAIDGHEAWKDMSKMNFQKTLNENDFENYNGNYFHKSVIDEKKINIYKSNKINPISNFFELVPDEKEYIIKTIELCKSKNVKVMFVTLPFLPDYLKTFQEDYEIHKRNLTDFLNNYDVEYYDLNTKPINGFDNNSFANDKAGRNQHLNYKGAIKSSLYLTSVLKSKYAILGNKSNINDPEYFIYNNELNHNPNNKFNAYIGQINKSLEKSVTINDDTIVVNGWMIVEGESGDDTEKFVCLVNDEFKYINLHNQIKVKMPRKEVSKRFNVDSLYDNCGFRATIDIKLIDKGSYDLVIATRDNKGYVRTKKTDRKIIIE